MKTGGGSKREGLGRGIHWHIENQVYYLPSDPLDQQIPYIRVVEDDGSITEYTDINAGLDPATIDPSELKLMDCITCHNRITHLIYPPDDTVDILMSRGLISPEIPGIKTLAVGVLTGPYPDLASAETAISNLKPYYAENFQDFVSEESALVDQAVTALQSAYRESNFPEQKADWRTHSNNIGHEDAPGCFRCHDGKHLNAEGEAVRLECNLCHAIPVVAGPPDFVANIEVSRGIEPQSHLSPNWIALHRDVFDPTCASCHTTEDPGGVSNSSFCSNSACHGSSWQYAGFDAPGLREILLAQLPPTPTPTALPPAAALSFQGVILPVFELRCVACHGPDGVQGLDLSTYEGVMEGGVNGPVVVPDDSAGSSLIKVQSGPQNHFGQLSAEELLLVARWIDAGAPQD
jgi:cytochrome c5